jgi:beta-lactamase regulating signal transducer with metallopeptidase domain
MTAIDHLLREPVAQAIGWALLHFVWQGMLVGVLTAIALAALRKGAADVRYVVATIGLSLMVTLPAVTAMQLWRSAPVSSGLTVIDEPGPLPAAASVAPGSVIDDQTARAVAPSSSRVLDSIRVEPWLPMLVLAWLSGVVILSLRLMSGWLWVQRMKSHGTSPIEDGWNVIAARLSRRLHIARTVRLLRSTLVEVPTVIGWLKPVILLPASALSGLNPHQLEAILSHELAHIRRHDYLVNLLQAVVETLLFYHPAVWWLSGRIRAERENCCDDLAVSLCGDPFTYAQALADLEGVRGSDRFAMAASGGSLVHRVKRLLGAPSHAGRAPGWLAASASLLVMMAVGAGVLGIEASQDVSPAPAAQAADLATAAKPATAASAEPRTQELRAVAGAIEDMQRTARLYDAAARAAAQVEGVTAHASTPFLASGPLAAKATAFEDAARSMAARASDGAPAVTASPAQLQVSHAVVAMDVAGTAVAGVEFAVRSGQSHGTYSWSNNGQKLEVRYDGEVEFTDDDTDVKSLTPGGLLRIRDGGMMTSLLGGHTIEFRADGSGNLTRRFWAGSSERPFEPEGRKWLASVLPQFIRQSGIGAPARVARILKQKGPSGVLAEISLIEGSWSKRRYFSELLKTATLDAATTRQVLVQAGREMDSDFELASFLIDNADKLLMDDATRQSYFDASRSIDSDFEMRRVFSAALKRGPVPPAVLVSMLNASHNIDSDFEQASLLIDVARLQPLDNTTRPAFFSALDTVQSDFEHRRVLSTLAGRTDLTPETSAAMLLSGASVDSDFEAATFLLELAKRQPIEGNVRAPFFRAVDSISSSFERGRVLQAVAKRPDASPDTILAVLRAASTMGSNFETSQVLLAVASTHAIEGPARDAYIATAEKLGDFEQGRTLSALVKSERRK